MKTEPPSFVAPRCHSPARPTVGNTCVSVPPKCGAGSPTGQTDPSRQRTASVLQDHTHRARRPCRTVPHQRRADPPAQWVHRRVP